MQEQKEELHSYYFAASGRLFGLVPRTSQVVCISHPVAFNAQTRVLSYRSESASSSSSSLQWIILPLDKAEQSKNPNLYEKTKVMLLQLTAVTAAIPEAQ